MNSITSLNLKAELDQLMQSAEKFNFQNRNDLESLYAYSIDGMEYDSEKFLISLFIKALNNKLNHESLNEHIYLKNFEIPQIKLFDILIDKFPFVKNSQAIINNSIIEIIKKHNEICIIDIGIGLGTQMINVLESVKDFKHLTKIQIIGIEPYEEALASAKKNIEAYNDLTNFEIEFLAVKDFAECVDYNQLPITANAIVVNASLALHHIQSQELRMKTIQNIKELNPLAFILTEPNVNHFECDFYQRYQNCYNHFYAIFRVIDQLDIDQNDKNALKQFFGREIEDIIGKSEENRYERHEKATQWTSRLTSAGFKLNTEFVNTPIPVQFGVKTDFHSSGYLGFTYEKETVLAVIYAQ